MFSTSQVWDTLIGEVLVPDADQTHDLLTAHQLDALTTEIWGKLGHIIHLLTYKLISST